MKNDLCIQVPSLFRCPISLDVMESPVSLCTGVTYDRSSITRWLDGGNNTCPATMQVLQTKEIIPNHTLHRLILIWSESAKYQCAVDTVKNLQSEQEENPPLSLSLPEILRGAEDGEDKALKLEHVKRIGMIAKGGEKNRVEFVKAGGVDVLARVLRVENGNRVLQEAVKALGRILAVVPPDKTTAEMLTSSEALSSYVEVLENRDDKEAVAECAKAVELIAASDPKVRIAMTEKEGLVEGLVKIVSSKTRTDFSAVEAALSCLISISITQRRIRRRIVELGVVSALGKLLIQTAIRGSVLESAMKLLELVSSCSDGRTAICGDQLCIPAIIGKILKTSDAATECGVVILWSVCHVFRDGKAIELAVKSGGFSRILLLMQSNCSPAVRQMATDLLKVFRVNGSNCTISSYDSKTAYVMPF